MKLKKERTKSRKIDIKIKILLPASNTFYMYEIVMCLIFIFRSDCVDILNKCVDRSRLRHNENPITLCEILSPAGNDTPCISLDPYLGQFFHYLLIYLLTRVLYFILEKYTHFKMFSYLF